MNSQGITLVETMLSLVILFILTVTLLPMASKLQHHLYNKKLELHASEAAYNAAQKIKLSQIGSGSFTIEDKLYIWNYDGSKICVRYSNLKGPKEKCIDSSGNV
ncbi:type II secretion system protein [Lysinibacillus sp. 54212]|uniref:type II secretion system protein n=1 Tax=Lysinibacillus sp. 54212 TaxID=3119829 RepID=UPI002FCC1DBE